MSDCPWKVRPFADDIEITCERPEGHEGRHEAAIRDNAYPGLRITLTWDHLYRCNFAGSWFDCRASGCVLPDGHSGDHAR